jgi:ribulose-bisphosphate carboxylase large chain
LDAPILPSPGGGMSVANAPADMAAMYGDDVVYLLGGSLSARGTSQIGDAVARDARGGIGPAGA